MLLPKLAKSPWCFVFSTCSVLSRTFHSLSGPITSIPTLCQFIPAAPNFSQRYWVEGHGVNRSPVPREKTGWWDLWVAFKFKPFKNLATDEINEMFKKYWFKFRMVRMYRRIRRTKSGCVGCVVKRGALGNDRLLHRHAKHKISSVICGNHGSLLSWVNAQCFQFDGLNCIQVPQTPPSQAGHISSFKSTAAASDRAVTDTKSHKILLQNTACSLSNCTCPVEPGKLVEIN